jgi:transketolase
VWEAIQIAAYYKCHNLIGIIDVNNLGQSTETMLDYDIESYKKRCEAFGWYPIAVNGHSIEELMAACDEAHSVQDRPVMIIARTIKGYGVDSVAGKQGFHGKAFNKNQEKTALEQLKARFPEASEYTGNNYMHLFQSVQDEHSQNFPQLDSTTEVSHKTRSVEKYEKNTLYATRKAYGNALADLGSTYPSIVCLDAEVKNSTYAELFEQAYPGRFLQCFVAEQNMVGMGIGFQKRGKIPFISTFSSFFSRAHDQIRMAAVSCSALRLVGSHCGVSIGEDGPSQMGLEDIAMMRCLPGSVVLYPSDAVSTYKLVEQMVHYAGGVSYLRTTRMETPVIYNHNQEFYIGGCTVLRHSTKDVACIVAAGVTLHEALKAHAILSQNDIFVSVIDLYSVKPLDASTVISVAQKSNNRIITVEDHYAEGGIGEAVLSAVCNTGIATHSLSVTRLPRSGKPEQLLAFEQIDAAAIVHLVQSFC